MRLSGRGAQCDGVANLQIVPVAKQGDDFALRLMRFLDPGPPLDTRFGIEVGQRFVEPTAPSDLRRTRMVTPAITPPNPALDLLFWPEVVKHSPIVHGLHVSLKARAKFPGN